MTQSPERQAKERMDDNVIVKDFRRYKEMNGERPTYPELVIYKRKRKAVLLGQPIEIIDDEDEGDEGEARHVIKRSQKKHR